MNWYWHPHSLPIVDLAEPLFGLLTSPRTWFVWHSCIQEENALPRKKMHNYVTTVNFSNAHSLQKPSPWLNNGGAITTVPVAFAYIECTITSTRATTNLVPRAFSSFKLAVGETPGQGCWNTPRIAEYFVTWHMIKWLFRRLFPASCGPVCFLKSETVIQTKRRHFIVFAWRNANELSEPLWQPWPGVSPTAILDEEKALGTRLGNDKENKCMSNQLFQKSHNRYTYLICKAPIFSQ